MLLKTTGSHTSRITMLGTFLAASVMASALQAELVYNWSFGDAGPMSPITGVISFDSVLPGVGGTSLTPDSIIITSAPGHTFTSGYVVGTEVIGSPLGALLNFPSNPEWSINTNDEIVAGGAAFIAAASGSADQLLLDSTNDFNSFLNTSAGITSASNLVFTPVPEPSTFGLAALGLLSLSFVGWRRRRR